MHTQLIRFIRDTYKTDDFILLHAPTFADNDRQYMLDTLDSAYVEQFEQQRATFTGSAHAVATINSTAALHISFYMADVQAGDLVITQPLTFVAICNALYHMGAELVFVDVSHQSLWLCPITLANWREEHASHTDTGAIHKASGRHLKAVVPMNTFGHPVELDELQTVCEAWSITLVEDAVESLGAYYKGKRTGTLRAFSALSFNGTKIITTGGSGMVLCQNAEQGVCTKHTTTAKLPHPFEFYHDEPGFNYRMPNLNAALGCAQMEALPQFLAQKRALAMHYAEFFKDQACQFVTEPSYGRFNYWLNAIVCEDQTPRDRLLTELNKAGVMTRWSVWKLMHRLPMFSHALRGELPNAEWLEAHQINLPSLPIEV